uniref:Uncharacterized protein n=1 Tax=Fagus sylvatica TaxID=28930 RepID=A0A2N9I4A2_FAGSY
MLIGTVSSTHQRAENVQTTAPPPRRDRLNPHPDRSDESESPPPSPPSSTFHFTSHLSNLVLYGGDLLEMLGDSSLHRHLSLLSARFWHSSEHRDPLRELMIGGHQIWGLLPVRPSIDPTFGVDSLKLFLKSPYHTRIAWHFLP